MTFDNKRDLSVSMKDANLYTVGLASLLILPLTILFSGIWGFKTLLVGISFISRNFVIFILLVIAGIFVHEYLHKIGWALIGKKPFSSISFGFQVKTLSPYAHCTEPMNINGYRWGSALPGILLGLLPAIVAIIVGNSAILIYGFVFIFAAGGDLLILWITRFLKAGTEIEDHPTRAGCYVLDDVDGTL
ncbi:MAG: DUF3267 domain-containing protein [Anaerolineaceae bacterium]|nr:DUF3267 domain-containing protein [Anaerolineaceae bacterium]